MAEYETMPQYELPFGDKISMTSDFSSMEDDDGPETPMMDTSYSNGCQKPEERPRDGNFYEQLQAQRSSNCGEDEEDEADVSPLTYARQNGLTTNYFDHPPLRSSCITPPSERPLEGLESTRLPDQGMEAAVKVDREVAHERWNIDKDTAELLASVISPAQADDTDLEEIVRMSDLKMDEPVLSMDPELDLLRLRARNTVFLSTEGMQPCTLNKDKEESLAWTSEDLEFASTINLSIVGAALPIDQETAELLKEVISPQKLDRWEMIEQAIDADQAKVCEMELASSPHNLFAQEASDVEAQLFEEDGSANNGANSLSGLGDNTSEHIQDLSKTPVTSSSSPLRQKRPRDLKVDTPLLHRDSELSPAKRAKTVLFPKELYTMIPEPETDHSMNDASIAHRDAGVMEGVVKPMAQSVEEQISNEKLDELDTTLRVDVPQIDAVKPLPPWSSANDEPARHKHTLLLSQIKNEVLADRKKWSGLSKIERALSWTPFPRYLGKVSLQEQFDDGSCEKYMAELSIHDGDIDIGPLLWKREGLRLLDAQESSDEELEDAGIEDEEEQDVSSPTAYESPADPAVQTVQKAAKPTNGKPSGGLTGMQALLQKRKFELETSNRPKANETSDPKRTVDDPGMAKVRTSAGNGMRISLTSGGLNRFLGLQGKQSPRAPIQNSPAMGPIEAIPIERVPEKLLLETTLGAAQLTLPAPKISDPTQNMSVVVSSNMLANRQVIREVQAILPALDLIERDDSSLAMKSSNRKVNVSEAHITISPSTGLICTTLQKLKQRPLPGQKTFFGIRDCIATVSSRHEHLIVLVTEGKQDDLIPIPALDERDTEAINDLIGHVAGLECYVEVCYVAGGDKDLAKWIVASVCRHVCDMEEAKLLNDETLWERLLRTAGANPALAQMILARLKRPEPSDRSENGDPSCYGLPTFVHMSAKERLQRFGPLMGGERALQRISSVLDQGWTSASQQ